MEGEAKGVIHSLQDRLHQAEAHAAGLQEQLGFQVLHTACIDQATVGTGPMLRRRALQ